MGIWTHCPASIPLYSAAEQGALHTTSDSRHRCSAFGELVSETRRQEDEEEQSRDKEPGQDRAGASYLSPRPAEMHQHGGHLVDLAAVEHSAAGQQHGHALGHGVPGEPPRPL